MRKHGSCTRTLLRALISSCVNVDNVLQKPILVTIQDMLVCLNKDVTSTLLSLIYFITD